jgi:hypothetical protein
LTKEQIDAGLLQRQRKNIFCLDFVRCSLVRANIRQSARRALKFIVAKEGVLAAARAVGASHAAHEEDGHAHRHYDGEQASIHREPMKQAMHTKRAYLENIDYSAAK